VRFRKRWLFLLLVLLAALPGFPPAIEWGLKRALAGVPGKVEWQSVSGYALTGLKLTGVKASGPGYEADVEELRVGYNLLALFGRKLPLSLDVRRGRINIDPKEFNSGGTDSSKSKIEPVLQRLSLEDVSIESDDWPRFALPPYRLEMSGDLSAIDWKLHTADGDVSGRLRIKSLDSWQTTFAGDVAVSRYWWNGQQSGWLEGVFGYRQGHWLGNAELSNGSVVLAGFPIDEITGSIDYKDHVITTALTGSSLGGPVQGEWTYLEPTTSFRLPVSRNWLN